ncbi:MAG: TolC family protein [Bacteroidia bacterium]|nr:TolC family protein [Bacteroidia bacterium]
MNITKRVSLLIVLAAAFLLAGNAGLEAQQKFSLQDCIQYGLKHNPDLHRAELEKEKSAQKVLESASGYLPQVRGSASLNDNLKLQTSILPGEIFGQPGQNVAVQFGTQYNVTAALDASQTLFDAGTLAGIRTARQGQQIASLAQIQTEDQLVFEIASAYYAAQITASQKLILESNLRKTDTLLTITQSRLDQGFANKTDYDRVYINQVNAQTDLENLELSYQQQLRLLKYYLGMAMSENLEIEEFKPEVQLPSTSQALNISANTDIRMLQLQKEQLFLNTKQIRAGYLPSLSLGFRYAYQAQQNTLEIIGKNSNWFPSSYLALSLNVPIFDGFYKSHKIQQLNLQLQQTEMDLKKRASYLSMQYENANSKLKTSLTALEIQSKNITLSEEVYQATRVQFKMGVASLSDLLNAETALKASQTNYIKALVQTKIAELDLLKSTGNIRQITE